MQPTLARAPFYHLGWINERKEDGWRMLAHKDGMRVRLVSRNGVDPTWRFHDIAVAISKLSPSTLVLDGEHVRDARGVLSKPRAHNAERHQHGDQHGQQRPIAQQRPIEDAHSGRDSVTAPVAVDVPLGGAIGFWCLAITSFQARRR